MSYVSEASELFISLYPETPILSPFDYLVIAEWEKQDIPLPLVLDTIRGISTKANADDRFGHLKQEIRDSFTVWLKEARPANTSRSSDQMAAWQ